MNGAVLSSDRVAVIVAFMFLHLLVFLAGATLLSAMGTDVVSSLSASAACLNNIGPGFGAVGPLGNYASFPAAGKWVLVFLMLIGRLELFTLAVLCLPDYWRQ